MSDLEKRLSELERGLSVLGGCVEIVLRGFTGDVTPVIVGYTLGVAFTQGQLSKKQAGEALAVLDDLNEKEFAALVKETQDFVNGSGDQA